MASDYQLVGTIKLISDAQSFNSGFTKREFVVTDEDAKYPQDIKFECIKDKCALMDTYNEGDEIKAHFNLSGRLWSGAGKPEKCFTSLQAWKVETVEAGMAENQAIPSGPYDTMYTSDANDSGYDDIPF